VRPLEIKYSRQSVRHFEAAGKWWRETLGASGLLSAEITRIVNLLAEHPYMGDELRNARRRGVRHWYLAKVGYHLYDLVDEEKARLEVVAFRHERQRPLRL
jgi:plasmid stabilization system protein ParE